MSEEIKTWHRIIFGDSRKMELVNDSSVHLIITSPPYFNARDYGVEQQIGYGDELKQYLDSIQKVFVECHRVLKPGRKFCLNISDLPAKGKYGVKWIPLGFYLLNACLKVGFEIVDRIIWHKTPMKGFHYGSLPYPPSPLICDSMEYIFILRKKGRADYSYVTNEVREASKLIPNEYGEYTKQIWTLGRVRLKDNLNGHIAPFPLELPTRCIKLYSFVDDVVLDPFGGSGTTVRSAIETHRNSIMYEINPNYLEIIQERIGLNQPRMFTDFEVKFVYVQGEE